MLTIFPWALVQFAPSKEISELIKQYDAEGAMAFEDAPGSWIHTTNEKGEAEARGQSGWFLRARHTSHSAEHATLSPSRCSWLQHQRVQSLASSSTPTYQRAPVPSMQPHPTAFHVLLPLQPPPPPLAPAGAKYWFNIHTNASRWNTPPSCAWQRITAQGKHFSYVNSVTAQTVGKLPKVGVVWVVQLARWLRARGAVLRRAYEHVRRIPLGCGA